jgi:hypothetical protein
MTAPWTSKTPLWSSKREQQRPTEVKTNEEWIEKRERELGELGARSQVDPPPELSPAEKKERELIERIERVEGRQDPRPPDMRKKLETRQENQLKEDLRLRLNQREVEVQDQRDKEHEKRAAKMTANLEAQIAEAEAQRSAMVERHRTALAELDAGLEGLRHKHQGLIRSLPPEESTEDRLRALELVI